MMIYIFTQRDPFFTDTFLEEFDKYNIPYNVFDFPNFNKVLIFGGFTSTIFCYNYCIEFIIPYDN